MLMEAKREGLVKEIGVSNYSVSQLEELLDKCNGKPDIVQNEFHPFLRSGVPEFCKKHGIKFEAHSIMACMEEYKTLSVDWELTPAQIAMAYAFQVGGGGVCFSTINFHHLVEDLNVQTLSKSQIQTLSQLVDKVQHARYKGADNFLILSRHPSSDLALLRGNDVDAVCAAMLPRLLSDIRALHEGGAPSNLAFSIPERPVANPLMAALAALVFNNTAPLPTARDERVEVLSRVYRLSNLLKRIRKRATAAADAARAASLASQTCKGAGAAVENPAALPVSIPAAAVFRPVIDALASLRAPPPAALRFERGTLFPDGRMDMCKQVAQPAFEDLCAAVRAGGAVRHFLLGNNLAFEGDAGAARVAALTGLMASDPPIATWYLAGNAMGPDAARAVAGALEGATHARHVWLKMNPLRAAGAAHFGRLAARNPHIETLDLFNTGLGDAGVAALLAAVEGGAAGLRHLYLDINGIGAAAADGLAGLLGALKGLESLFLSVNRLGDAGALRLCAAMAAGAAPRLRRLGLGSVGATDAALGPLAAAAAAAPALVSVELGVYKSTRFFGEEANRIARPAALLPLARALRANADRAAAAAAAAGDEGPDGCAGVCYLGFQHALALPPPPALNDADADADAAAAAAAAEAEAAGELEAALAALEAMGVEFNGIQYHGRGRMSPRTPALRRCRHPAAVDHIESVYRNNM